MKIKINMYITSTLPYDIIRYRRIEKIIDQHGREVTEIDVGATLAVDHGAQCQPIVIIADGLYLTLSQCHVLPVW
ncbi:hypothetical protein [Olivibacter sitiensis]|uniref:hypothetical protein n=1 Tax=Olivibacter sitiensis TaxID=376470 RepID=UPI000415434B|nr:hypothetical protein [Olivibacter sitiensis]